MRDWGSQLDVTHALSPHLATRDLYSAPIADYALITHSLVLAAVALPVTLRTKYLLTKQAFAFRLEGPIVNGLRLLDRKSVV